MLALPLSKAPQQSARNHLDPHTHQTLLQPLLEHIQHISEQALRSSALATRWNFPFGVLQGLYLAPPLGLILQYV